MNRQLQVPPPSAADSAPALKRLLLVDDGEVFRERLARAFRERGYAVRTAGDFDEALASAREHAPQLAVIDLRMPGRGGLELLRELKRLDPSIHVLVLTGYGSIATAVEAVRLGACNYLPKPADADDILAAFQRSAAMSRPAPRRRSGAGYRGYGRHGRGRWSSTGRR